MTEMFSVDVQEKEGGVVILRTHGYLNNLLGKEIISICEEKIAEGRTHFLIDFKDTQLVNSLGVSILLEVIQKLQMVEGALGSFNLSPMVNKTFIIMGLDQYSNVFTDESEAVKAYLN